MIPFCRRWCSRCTASGCDPGARTFYTDWDKAAHEMAAALRVEAGRNPHDRVLSDPSGLLSTRSEEFRVQWARHEVWFHRSGIKRLHRPLAGGLTLAYEVLDLSADPGLTLAIYAAEAGSASEKALLELDRWSTTRAKLTSIGVETQV
ncbi:MAG: hypothetical protein HYX54_10895 [Chloroflexi bacterium]|nr:hypothetical protein [Chloroflexota bacterium]